MKTIIFDFTETEDKIIQNLNNRLISGLENAGSEIEHIGFKSLYVENCRECTTDLFFYQDGNCKCQDDLTKVYSSIRDSKNLIFVIDSYNSNSLHNFFNLLNRLEPIFPNSLDGTEIIPLKNVIGLFYISLNDTKYYKFFVNALEEFSLLFKYDFLGTLQIRNIEILKSFSEFSISKLGIYEDIEHIGFELVKKNAINDQIKKKLQDLSYIDDKIGAYLSKLKLTFNS